MREPPRRRLAAIMFSDMLGYTALMQENEEAARAGRDRYRAVLGSAVERHHGEILQHYGDGTLSVFGSAVQAVRCAIDVQSELSKAPEVPVRIGLHTGDIAQDEHGVYGDGVNVASRIESLAPSGGVLISGKLYDEIKNQPTIAAVPLGAVRLKNVGRPTQLFAIRSEGLAVPTADEMQERAARGVAGEGHASAGARAGAQGAGSPGLGEAFLTHARNAALLQWALVYGVAAWAFLASSQFVVELFGWSSSVFQGARLLAIVGFFVAMVVAWFHGERGRQPIRRLEVLVIGLLIVAGATGLSALRELRSGQGAGGVSTSAERLPPREDRPSVAVLPFESLSPDPENAYFASGLHDELLTQLQRLEGLRVTSRASVMEYADERPNVRDIASNLGVSHVIEGSVQRIGSRLRVNVTLTDARVDESVWAERYDRELDDAFDVQSDVAQRVAEALAATLMAHEQGGVSR